MLDAIGSVQEVLEERGLGGWLLYDFKGQNPTARNAMGLHSHMLTRRWFYFVPSKGTPVLLVHAIEEGSFPSVPGEVQTYAGWEQLEQRLKELLRGAGRVAMEYFPRGAIPYLSRVDAGTVELVRGCGVEVVSSAEIVQHFLCRLDEWQRASHERAAGKVHAAKDEAFRFISDRLAAGEEVTETRVQALVGEAFERMGLITDHPCIVAVNAHAGDPHYVPSESRRTPIRPGDLVLLDLWAKENHPRAVFADITWMAHAGRPTDEEQRVFEIVRDSRDVGLRTVEKAHAERRTLQGWEVDRAVRDFITARGYGDRFIHRTGHNIGAQADHGDGANLDDLETHDTRPLVSGLCFSIEPGVYLPHFGVRSEIDVFLDDSGAHVYGPMQKEFVLLRP